MSVNPESSPKTFEMKTCQAPVSRPVELNPIIMSGWVTPWEKNEDIQNPAKKRIKVSELPYVHKKEDDDETRTIKRY